MTATNIPAPHCPSCSGVGRTSKNLAGPCETCGGLPKEILAIVEAAKEAGRIEARQEIATALRGMTQRAARGEMAGEYARGWANAANEALRTVER